MIPLNMGARPLLAQRRAWIGAPEPAPKAFIDSPMVSFLTDMIAAVPAGIIAWEFQKAGSKWSNFFWGITVAAGMKGMIDLSRIQQKQERA